MREVWKEIDQFPLYAVSDLGRVKNQNSDYIKAISRNQDGIVHVVMMDPQTRGQSRRSVAWLVAEAFLPPAPRADFNTIIHLNGDYEDCRAENLALRPRWFTIRYHKQFRQGHRGYNQPIQDMETGEIYQTSWEAARMFGLIDEQILIAMTNNTYVFPTGQRFRLLV